MDRQLILGIGCMSVGAVLALGSLYLLLKQKPVVDQQGNVTEVDIPLFGKLRSNYPSLVAFFIAAFLVWFPVYVITKAPRKIPVSGKITLPGNGDASVGIVAGPVVVLGNDGKYKLDVLDGEQSYNGVAFYSIPGSPKQVYVATVEVKNGVGTFDATFGRQP